jgi:Spy/CpxP family protein refolding chaperone
MKSLTLILGALTLLSSIASATASHRSSSSSQDGRYQHLESRGAVVGQKGGGRGRVIRPSVQHYSEGERNWFKQSSGEYYGGCDVSISKPC